MTEAFPIWVIVTDYVLGVVMWTLIGRFGMGIFLPETSNFFFMRFFVRATNPLLKLFAPITPDFLVPPVIPLYVAWFFFMVRFYLMPWLRSVFYGIDRAVPVTELWWDIQPISAGVFGVPLGFAVIVVVSLLTRAPSRETQDMVEQLRYPNLRPA